VQAVIVAVYQAALSINDLKQLCGNVSGVVTKCEVNRAGYIITHWTSLFLEFYANKKWRRCVSGVYLKSKWG
jgi:hypothetical protein